MDTARWLAFGELIVEPDIRAAKRIGIASIGDLGVGSFISSRTRDSIVAATLLDYDTVGRIVQVRVVDQVRITRGGTKRTDFKVRGTVARGLYSVE